MTVESAEVATLKSDGRPWDGPGGARLPRDELSAFFALDLTRQLERLVRSGEPPTPPDVFVRVHRLGRDGEELLVETGDDKSFDPRWGEADPDATVEIDLSPGARLRARVLDRDVLFDDAIGEIEVELPSVLGPDGRWTLGPFGQVRRLVIRLTP